MYFWRIDKLKAELRQGALPQRQQFYYYLAESILLALAMIHFSDPNNFDVGAGIATVFVTALGVAYLYRCNAGDRGSQFLERSISLGFVVTVRLIVLLVLPLGIVYFLALWWLPYVPLETTLVKVVIGLFIEIFVLWRIGIHLRQVAQDSVA